MSERRIVVVGSLNMDLAARCERLPGPGETVMASEFATHCGGKGGNQAVAAARLGGRIAMVGRVGEDPFGETLVAALAADGVDVAHVTRTPGPSGVALIGAGGGENLIMVAPGANAKLSAADIAPLKPLLAEAAVVLCQLETPLATVAAVAEAAALLVLDPAPAQALPRELLARVAWLTPNESEAAILLGRPVDDPARAAEALLALGPRNVALKLGARGCWLAGADVAAGSVPAPRVDAIDPTAAGDCFNGAFAVALAAGVGPRAAAEFACRAAALSVTRFGAQPSLPRRAEL